MLIRTLLLAAAGLVSIAAQAAPVATLCKPQERAVFACRATKKLVSLCAAGDLQKDGGRLIYRFGRDAAHVEMEHGAAASPRESGFSYDYWSWAKGEAVMVGFMRGDFTYLVYHAAGAFGVDGGPNVASVRVLRNAREVVEISCHEPSATDHIYEELNKLGLSPRREY